MNISDLYLFLYLLSVLMHRLNISFSMANASLATSLSVMFRSSLSLTLLYRMSVSDRRMFCLIWWLGGGGMGDEGGAEEAEWRDLDEEWPEREEEEEEPGDEDTLEDLLSDGLSLGCGCFLGMVKLDLVTLSAPVTWMGPGG